MAIWQTGPMLLGTVLNLRTYARIFLFKTRCNNNTHHAYHLKGDIVWWWGI